MPPNAPASVRLCRRRDARPSSDTNSVLGDWYRVRGDGDHALDGLGGPNANLLRNRDLEDAIAKRSEELLRRDRLHVLADRQLVDRLEHFPRVALAELVQDARLGGHQEL